MNLEQPVSQQPVNPDAFQVVGVLPKWVKLIFKIYGALNLAIVAIGFVGLVSSIAPAGGIPPLRIITFFAISATLSLIVGFGSWYLKLWVVPLFGLVFLTNVVSLFVGGFSITSFQAVLAVVISVFVFGIGYKYRDGLSGRMVSLLPQLLFVITGILIPVFPRVFPVVPLSGGPDSIPGASDFVIPSEEVKRFVDKDIVSSVSPITESDLARIGFTASQFPIRTTLSFRDVTGDGALDGIVEVSQQAGSGSSHFFNVFTRDKSVKDLGCENAKFIWGRINDPQISDILQAVKATCLDLGIKLLYSGERLSKDILYAGIITADIVSGRAPLTVEFSVRSWLGLDGQWIDFGDEQRTEVKCLQVKPDTDLCIKITNKVSHTYTRPGTYTARYQSPQETAGSVVITVR